MMTAIRQTAINAALIVVGVAIVAAPGIAIVLCLKG
jgi:hypothetical protein